MSTKVGRRISVRKKKQNRLGMFLVMIVVLMLLLVVSYKSTQLKVKQNNYLKVEAQLNEQIKDEHARSEEIEEFRKYTKTKKYVEEVAKDKLGLVYDDEIIFKED